ncbi:Gfo/Idh/MocA family oxidoreductase [Thermocrinis minervae]|uniref:Predicted dehydrogenase n=1 Tax=Thermocrinis minervae TaxID=381751 RepID=A0A1M6SQ23_9AQUI|nr:Gfo/Idh/MocA family oxidoreductase [Thermocrinis minervae]SHK46795.1 Predicted dehydrogenase [Thermocrinis minervae]
MHILLIGLGNMGSKYLQKIKQMGESPVLCDIDSSKRDGEHPFYCHYGEVNEPLKAVIIAIDPSKHVDVALAFLEKGLPVLLEKPPALSSKDFERISSFDNLYVSEVESFSVCAEHIPKNAKSIKIERFGRGKGYVSPLWDLAWHDLYLLLRTYSKVEVKELSVKNGVWTLRGYADQAEFELSVQWESPHPRRIWNVDEGKVILDFGEEAVYSEGRLMVQRKRDKLRWMLESFLLGDYDRGSVERAGRIINIIENIS